MYAGFFGLFFFFENTGKHTALQQVKAARREKKKLKWPPGHHVSESFDLGLNADCTLS